MTKLRTVFAFNRTGVNTPRGLIAVGVLAIPLVILSAIGREEYWLSASFGALFVGLSDPGGGYGVRVREMGWFALVGTLLTGLGFAIGAGPWGWVALAAFLVTLLSGLAMKYGLHRATAALLLCSWFLVVISVSAGDHLSPSHSHWAGQALAWLGGAALWIGLTLIGWLVRGLNDQASHFPEIPGDMAVTTLSKPVIVFAFMRAAAITIAIAIAFGLHLPNADWMPIATLAAMKGSLDQTTVVAEQRLFGALLGALIAIVFLLTVDNKYALEVVIVLLGSVAASIRGASYAFYCAAVAGTVLIATDIPHPTNVSAEFRRVLFTLAGVGIAWLVMLLANQMQKRQAAAAK
jgi:fusaric acid resistance family protein